MNFEEIMNKIKIGLTGEVEKDVIYIMHKTAEYKKSPFAERINKETSKMIYDMLPDSEKALFRQVLQNDDNEVNKKIENSLKSISEGNYMEAIKIIEEIIPNICADGQSDENFDYVSLNNLFEICIYSNIYKKDRLVKPAKFNFSYIYRLYGYCLFKLSRDNEAEKAYNDALFWNPIDVSIMLDLSEIMYLNKKYKNFLELIKKCFKYSYNINQISLCYFNLGRYYFKKENYELSVNMYILSHYFKPNKAALNKLEEIKSIKGIKIIPPEIDKMREICHKTDIPMGVNPDIIKLAINSGTDAKRHGNFKAAKYFYDILFSLTGDKTILDTFFEYTKNIKNNSDNIKNKQQPQ